MEAAAAQHVQTAVAALNFYLTAYNTNGALEGPTLDRAMEAVMLARQCVTMAVAARTQPREAQPQVAQV